MDILKKLVDIDEQAKKMHSDNDRQREKLSLEIEEEAKKTYEKYLSDAKELVETKTAEIRDEAENDFRKKDDARSAKLNSLEELYKQNQTKWVDEIVERVLG